MERQSESCTRRARKPLCPNPPFLLRRYIDSENHSGRDGSRGGSARREPPQKAITSRNYRPPQSQNPLAESFDSFGGMLWMPKA